MTTSKKLEGKIEKILKDCLNEATGFEIKRTYLEISNEAKQAILELFKEQIAKKDEVLKVYRKTDKRRFARMTEMDVVLEKIEQIATVKIVPDNLAQIFMAIRSLARKGRES